MVTFDLFTRQLPVSSAIIPASRFLYRPTAIGVCRAVVNGGEEPDFRDEISEPIL